ncbi:MAG: hypothetical protein JO280_06065 [Mycobacteriaceae bacterium]|nr:hypothetical protein [Mycobacteriaceae bacterium]
MPSVPQSLLWISLVVLWLFVLVPMLISKRDAVRRTSDVALATRVLNSGVARKLRKGPAAGHRSDPDWQPIADDDELEDDAEPGGQGEVVQAADVDLEQDFLDADVVNESKDGPPAEVVAVDEPPAGAEPQLEANTEPEPVPVVPDDETPEENTTSAEYETVEDTSGLESEDDPPTIAVGSRRRLYESRTAAAVSARKYRFRKRVLSLMTLILVGTTAAAVTVWPGGWWACGGAGVITLLYLAYLRRQTRIEERVRRRRMQRMARAHLGVQNTADADYDVPSRLRRPGSVVLEIDDEDPTFDHLEYPPGSMDYHLPKASGQ